METFFCIYTGNLCKQEFSFQLMFSILIPLSERLLARLWYPGLSSQMDQAM
jgi:hypothetical protein